MHSLPGSEAGSVTVPGQPALLSPAGTTTAVGALSSGIPNEIAPRAMPELRPTAQCPERLFSLGNVPPSVHGEPSFPCGPSLPCGPSGPIGPGLPLAPAGP